MALIQWKQINPELLDSGLLTGSLQISGSIIVNGVNISGAASSENLTTSIAALSSSTHTANSSLSASLSISIAQEKTRIDTILSASTIDKDSFAEIATFIASVEVQDYQNLATFITSSNTRSTNIENSVTSLSSSLSTSIIELIAGTGLEGGGTQGNVLIGLNTGSAHFITGVIDLNIFQQTGTYYSTANNLQVTGSLVLRGDQSGNVLSVHSGSLKTFSITDTGVLEFISQSNMPPPITGGMYFDTDYNLHIGQE